jgi:hypothetical protein
MKEKIQQLYKKCQIQEQELLAQEHLDKAVCDIYERQALKQRANKSERNDFEVAALILNTQGHEAQINFITMWSQGEATILALNELLN